MLFVIVTNHFTNLIDELPHVIDLKKLEEFITNYMPNAKLPENFNQIIQILPAGINAMSANQYKPQTYPNAVMWCPNCGCSTCEHKQHSGAKNNFDASINWCYKCVCSHCVPNRTRYYENKKKNNNNNNKKFNSFKTPSSTYKRIGVNQLNAEAVNESGVTTGGLVNAMGLKSDGDGECGLKFFLGINLMRTSYVVEWCVVGF